jgi:hypothetical protein
MDFVTSASHSSKKTIPRDFFFFRECFVVLCVYTDGTQGYFICYQPISLYAVGLNVWLCDYVNVQFVWLLDCVSVWVCNSVCMCAFIFVKCILFAAHCVLLILCSVYYVSYVLYTVYCTLCNVHMMHCVLHALCTVCYVIVFCILCTVYSILCILSIMYVVYYV